MIKVSRWNAASGECNSQMRAVWKEVMAKMLRQNFLFLLSAMREQVHLF